MKKKRDIEVDLDELASRAAGVLALADRILGELRKKPVEGAKLILIRADPIERRKPDGEGQ